MIPTRTKKKAIAADDMQWLFSCSFLGQVVPVRSFFQLLYVPGKNFLVKADRGVYLHFPDNKSNKCSVSGSFSVYHFKSPHRTIYHLYPQLLHSNCERAVLLNTPNAHPWAAFFMPDILLMLGDWHVGHLGMLSE